MNELPEKALELPTSQLVTESKELAGLRARIGGTLGTVIGVGFGPGFLKALGETMHWGSLATYGVGLPILAMLGALAGGLASWVISVYEKSAEV